MIPHKKFPKKWMNIQHSSRTDDWGTPEIVLSLVYDVLKGIDLDPASDLEWNKTVGANRIITKKEDGLITPWAPARTVYVNPPGGKTKNRSNTALFWARLMQYRHEFDHAIFMAFSAEALQNTQDRGIPTIMDFPFCVPSKRVKFVAKDGMFNAPSHSNVIVYVPGKLDHTSEFLHVFSKLGAVKR